MHTGLNQSPADDLSGDRYFPAEIPDMAERSGGRAAPDRDGVRDRVRQRLEGLMPVCCPRTQPPLLLTTTPHPRDARTPQPVHRCSLRRRRPAGSAAARRSRWRWQGRAREDDGLGRSTAGRKWPLRKVLCAPPCYVPARHLRADPGLDRHKPRLPRKRNVLGAVPCRAGARPRGFSIPGLSAGPNQSLKLWPGPRAEPPRPAGAGRVKIRAAFTPASVHRVRVPPECAAGAGLRGTDAKGAAPPAPAPAG